MSLIISAGVYALFRSWSAAIASFLAGVFLDIDHILDYFINYGLRFNLKDFYDCCEEARFKTLSLVLHSYELMALLWIAIIVFGLGDIWKALAIGASQHLIFDQIFNRARHETGRRVYFLIHRLVRRFNKEEIFKKRCC